MIASCILSAKVGESFLLLLFVMCYSLFVMKGRLTNTLTKIKDFEGSFMTSLWGNFFGKKFWLIYLVNCKKNGIKYKI